MCAVPARRSLAVAAALLATAAGLAPPATGATLRVAAPPCSDGATRTQAVGGVRLCSIQRAATLALPGDVVRIAAGTYPGSVRPPTSGRPGARIVFVGEGAGATVDAQGAADGLLLVGVSDIRLTGIGVIGAARHGVWLDGTARIELDHALIRGGGGQGVALKASTAAHLHDLVIRDNATAGVAEHATSAGNRYRRLTVTGNGRDGAAASGGQGLQLEGDGFRVQDSTVTANGDPGSLYEHGIYAARTASGFLIERSMLSGNAGADIKAAGSAGTIRYNRLGSAGKGLVFADNASATAAYENLIVGVFQHAVFLTSDAAAARAVLWHNQIVQTGRCAGCTGSASAVFVASSAEADLRNNVICFSGDASAGVALELPDPARALRLRSNHNWLSSTDAAGRHVIRGAERLTLAGWVTASGQDAMSVASAPPTFDSAFRVTSANLGAGRGEPLGIRRDYAGRWIPPEAPDIGAYQG
jgi:hypothetical protein